MNKLVTVLGVAAVATLAGCKDPNYQSMSAYSQDEVKVVEPAPAAEVKPVAQPKPAPVAEVKPAAQPKPAPVVEVKPVAPAPAPEPAFTIYVVQNGDYLAKISKKFNLTIGSIKRLNGMKSDMIRVGQKLKLPGKIDVGVQSAPAKVSSARATSGKAASKKISKSSAEYTGATKEYVVKNGDTLGAVAYGNGCNIRQLKKLNNLTSDSLKVGQKLKVPAGKAAAASAKPAAKAEVVKKEAAKVETPAPAAPVAEPAPAEAATPAAPVEAAKEEAAPAAAEPAPAAAKPAEAQTATYTVKEGDDMTGVSIRWGVTAAAIRELNNLAEDAQLTPGQVIKLPADAQQ